MSSYSYVEGVNVNLLCCICQTPFNNPLTTRTCSHTFCQECIVTALSMSQHCPIDRSPLTTGDLMSADPLVRNLVDELQVECPMRPAGCMSTCQRQLLASHLRDDCLYVEVPCADGLCDKVTVRKVADHRAHTDQSDQPGPRQSTESSQPTECDGCNMECTPEALADHRASCPNVLVTCTQAVHGCDWKGTRDELTTSHLPHCAYEGIKGFFAIQEKHMSSLTEENAVLRHKVAALDGVITSLKRELSAVKLALGPWYRLDGSTNSWSRIQSSAATSSRSEAPRPSSSVRVADGVTEQAQQVPTATSTPNSSDLSSYFPSSEQDDFLPLDLPSGVDNHVTTSTAQQPASTSFATYQLPASPTTHRTPYVPFSPPQSAGYNIPTATSPPQSPVAPLDISSTLEGSLEGLRGSVVAISAALDSLGRKHEVALTTESMRNTEEIRSLRAIIHGLRMQVHSIIMDRNAQTTGRLGEDAGVPMWLPEMHDAGPSWMRLPFPPRYPYAPISVPPPGSVPKL
ncbi:hypothetical protein BDW22DRAFT_1091035 [Trametopsis cervina]|nr:hypothetical protein BDW22DRAFT_1091035 [Trametopsis cervina]